MATLYPGAEYRPLGTQTEPRLNTHDIIVLHTMAGYLGGSESMFEDEGYGGTESHFGIGGSWDEKYGNGDGEVWQWQDLDYQADANLEGNWHCISVETSDGAQSGPPPWTQKQLDALVGLCAWLCDKYNIPRSLIPDTKPGRRGIGYHAQGIEPNLVSGGEKWSDAYGKVCPGSNRIAQIKNYIIPALGGSAPVAPPEPGGGGFPGFPLPSGHYFGPADGPASSHSGYYSASDKENLKTWQQRMRDRGWALTADGYYGPETEEVALSFQEEKGLTTDGLIGRQTWDAAWTSPVT